MVGIYIIRNKVNGMVYVGKSIDIDRRWREERLRNPQVNNHLLNAFRKYGMDSFDFSVIEECEVGILDDRERYWIQAFQSHDKKKGYNKTLGGEGGNWTDEIKNRFAVKMTGEGNHFHGKKHTAESLERMSKAKTGKRLGYRHKESTKQKMSEKAMGGGNPRAKEVHQYTKDGVYIRSFSTPAVAGRELGIGSSGIINSLNGLSRSSGGFCWKYVKDQKETE